MVKTVAVLFVNNHILSGKQNFQLCKFLIDELCSLRYQIERVSFVNENERVIAEDLSALSKQFDVVIVIGELKTNVIFKALGNIFCEELVKNPKFSNNLSISDESYDMNLLPSAAKFLTLDAATFPIIYLQRIFILKEECAEKLFSQLLKQHLEYYRAEPKFTKSFYVQLDTLTRDNLENIKSIATVSTGSKQKFGTVVLEKTNFETFIECERILRKEICGIVEEVCDKSYLLDSIYKNKEEHIQHAIENIQKCLETYGPENVFLSFNGGKDCTVMLHLMYVVMKVKYANYKHPIFCVYVRSNDVFPEQDKFISQCQVYFNLEVMSISLGMKEALEEVLKRKPHLKACLMGTRRTDPYSGELNTFQITDPSWPRIMRVSPLLEWHYSDIWDYLLYYKVPYCKLYDLGYTSLGNASNTVQNPCLLYRDVKLGRDVFLPAYKMLNEAEERNGRNILQ